MYNTLMKGKKRHDFIYKVFSNLIRRIISRKFNFEYETIKPEKSPYIVISNHLTNWDPVFIGLSFTKNMYYVASDQIFRMGFKTWLLKYFFDPIPNAKTKHETQTVISIFRRLRDNCNICIFAEGMTSFDGETGLIMPSIAKLIKKAGVTLITYRFTGSYFTFPRWARFVHKGKMQGRLAQIYPPEKIASMSEDEIYEAIRKDIYVDAYADQKENLVKYIGKKPAEYLETALYCCPDCGEFASLKSHNDILSCVCGYEVRYNEYGFFELPFVDAHNPAGKEVKPLFTTILDWAKWQKRELITLAETNDALSDDIPVFSDEDQSLYEIEGAKKAVLLLKGKMCMYKDRLSIIADNDSIIEFPFEKIIEISCFAKMRMIFYANDKKLYEIHSKHPRSAVKYIDFFNAVKNTKE